MAVASDHLPTPDSHTPRGGRAFPRRISLALVIVAFLVQGIAAGTLPGRPTGAGSVISTGAVPSGSTLAFHSTGNCPGAGGPCLTLFA